MRGVEIESVDRLIDFLHCGFVYRAGQGCAQFMAGFNGFGIAVNELLGKACELRKQGLNIHGGAA